METEAMDVVGNYNVTDYRLIEAIQKPEWRIRQTILGGEILWDTREDVSFHKDSVAFIEGLHRSAISNDYIPEPTVEYLRKINADRVATVENIEEVFISIRKSRTNGYNDLRTNIPWAINIALSDNEGLESNGELYFQFYKLQDTEYTAIGEKQRLRIDFRVKGRGQVVPLDSINLSELIEQVGGDTLAMGLKVENGSIHLLKTIYSRHEWDRESSNPAEFGLNPAVVKHVGSNGRNYENEVLNVGFNLKLINQQLTTHQFDNLENDGLKFKAIFMGLYGEVRKNLYANKYRELYELVSLKLTSNSSSDIRDLYLKASLKDWWGVARAALSDMEIDDFGGDIVNKYNVPDYDSQKALLLTEVTDALKTEISALTALNGFFGDMLDFEERMHNTIKEEMRHLVEAFKDEAVLHEKDAEISGSNLSETLTIAGITLAAALLAPGTSGASYALATSLWVASSVYSTTGVLSPEPYSLRYIPTTLSMLDVEEFLKRDPTRGRIIRENMFITLYNSECERFVFNKIQGGFDIGEEIDYQTYIRSAIRMKLAPLCIENMFVIGEVTCPEGKTFQDGPLREKLWKRYGAKNLHNLLKIELDGEGPVNPIMFNNTITKMRILCWNTNDGHGSMAYSPLDKWRRFLGLNHEDVEGTIISILKRQGVYEGIPLMNIEAHYLHLTADSIHDNIEEWGDRLQHWR